MTWLDVLLYGPGWLACALIPVNWLAERRFRRRCERCWERPPQTWDVDGAVITWPRQLTETEVEEFKARWLRVHGRPPSSGKEQS